MCFVRLLILSHSFHSKAAGAYRGRSASLALCRIEVARDVHGVMQHANDEDASVLYDVEHDVAGVPMTQQPRPHVIGGSSQAWIFSQGLQAFPQTQEIGVGFGLAKGPVRILIDFRQVAVSLVGKDVLSRAADGPSPPP
jgi:hypothetical protein